MSEKRTLSKILLVIPLLLLVVTVFSFILASLLEFPTSRGSVYIIFAFISVMSLFLSPLPCIAAAILGIYFARKAAIEDNVKSTGLIVLGIIEIIVYVEGLSLGFLPLVFHLL